MRATTSAGATHALGFDVTNKVVVDGFIFDNFTTNPIGFWGTGYTDIVLRNITLNLTGSEYNEGIVFYGEGNDSSPVISSVTMENIVVNDADMGISCNSGPCKNFKLTDVVISNGEGGNGSGADCFAVEDGDNIFLENVETTGCSADGIDIKGTRVLLINPFVHNIGRNGIKLWNGGDVINGLVYDTAADSAIVFNSAGTYRIINSTIALHNAITGDQSYMMTAGYDASSDAIDVQLINSIFYSNNGTVLGFPNRNGTTRKLTIQNSLFYDVGLGEGIEAVIDSGDGNLKNIDPQFVNSGRYGDFNLKTSSPAFRSGQDTEYNFDRLNKERGSGSFNIGVY